MLQIVEVQRELLMNNYHITTTFIGDAYPPSLMPLSSLVPINLDDMSLERHHRGRMLIVKTFCQPIRISGIKNAIEDVLGNVDLLSICNLPSATPVDSVLPKSAVLAVKEPYYEVTADGSMVRVDHPSDLVLLEPHDLLVPRQWRADHQSAMTVSELKTMGDKALEECNWKEAARLYSEALVNCDKTHCQVRLGLHRNRAQAYLNLGQYELAEEEFLAAVITGDDGSKEVNVLNAKAYLGAGQAQYLLRNFILAKNYFDQALCLDPADKAVAAELERTSQRIHEQESGQFDLAAMAESVTSSNRRLDYASFTRNTRIASAGNRRRGLFATKDIKDGGLVIVEKAFCVKFGDEVGKQHSMIMWLNRDGFIFGAHSERLYDTIDQMRRNPKQASKLLDLANGEGFGRKHVDYVDGSVVVDAFQIQAIMKWNGFGCPGIRSAVGNIRHCTDWSGGIWIHAAYMNRSRMPNTSRVFFGDMMIVRAIRDIKAGEEILTYAL